MSARCCIRQWRYYMATAAKTAIIPWRCRQQRLGQMAWHIRLLSSSETPATLGMQSSYLLLISSADAYLLGSLADHIRNIGIIAHIDAGKTTTTERMLYYAGYTSKIGDVDAGSTVMDFLPQERERGITINSAAITFGWCAHRINLIDTPGHVDFTFEVERALRVLDGAVTIFDGVAGVEAQTETVWHQANRYRIPRLAFVNKLDREGANFSRTIEMMRKQLHTWGVPIICQVPLFGQAMNGLGAMSNMASTGTAFGGVIDVITMETIHWKNNTTGSSVNRQSIPLGSALYTTAITARSVLLDILGSKDDTMLEVYLECESAAEVPSSVIKDALRRTTLNGTTVPVFCGASFRNMGVQPLMDAIVDYLPSPNEKLPPSACLTHPRDNNGEATQCSIALTDKRSCALAFKVVHDLKRGLMVYVRVYSGTLTTRAVLTNTTRQCQERVNKILIMYADNTEEITSLEAGNIGVLIGLKKTCTGDTLISTSDTRTDLTLQSLPAPPPVFMCAVEPASPRDEKSLDVALHSIVREDPSVYVTVDAETGQTLISGMGELHMEITRDRLLNVYKVNASLGKMRIAYRETVAGLAPNTKHSIVYEREIAGKLMRAGLSMNISLLTHTLDKEDSNIIRLDDRLSESLGNRIKTNMGLGHLVPLKSTSDASVSSIIYNAALANLSAGPLLGFNMTNLSIELHSLVLFPETAPATISSATNMLLNTYFRSLATSSDSAQAHVRLLEPIMTVEVVSPHEHIGTVVRDISSKRRGKIISIGESAGDKNIDTSTTLAIQNNDILTTDRQTIRATVPLSELIGYSGALRSLTGGAGTFTMKLLGYGLVGMTQTAAVSQELRGF